MDDLSNKIPHHKTQVDTVFHNILTAPDVSFSNTKFVTAHSSSTPHAPLPSNNDFLIASFTPREISQVMKLLQTHKSLLPQNLQPELQNTQNYKKIISYLISDIAESTKSLFLPFYIPGDSMFSEHCSLLTSRAPHLSHS